MNVKKSKTGISSHWYTDGIDRKRFKENAVPEGWYLAPMLKRKPKHWITDGKTEILIPIDAEIPQGWQIGISQARKQKISATESGKCKSEHQRTALKKTWTAIRKNKHWYNDGFTDGLFEDGKQPENWVRGQGPTRKAKNSAANMGKKMPKESAIKRVETRMKNKSYIVAEKTREKLRLKNLGKKQTSATINKRNDTKLKNKTFNTSNVQQTLQNLFMNLYSDTKIEYKEDSRYPFAADIYIPRFDLFIEINGFWTHGEHPFESDNAEDIARLNELKAKQNQYIDSNNKLKNNSYHIAEKVWTQSDPLKSKYAEKNNLNYLVLYNVNMRNIQLFEKLEIEKNISGICIMNMDKMYKNYCEVSNNNV